MPPAKDWKDFVAQTAPYASRNGFSLEVSIRHTGSYATHVDAVRVYEASLDGVVVADYESTFSCDRDDVDPEGPVSDIAYELGIICQAAGELEAIVSQIPEERDSTVQLDLFAPREDDLRVPEEVNYVLPRRAYDITQRPGELHNWLAEFYKENGLKKPTGMVAWDLAKLTKRLESLSRRCNFEISDIWAGTDGSDRR